MGPQPNTSYLRPRKTPGEEAEEPAERLCVSEASPLRPCVSDARGLRPCVSDARGLRPCVSDARGLPSDPLMEGNQDSALTAARFARQAWKTERQTREPPRRPAAQPCPEPPQAFPLQSQAQSAYPPVSLKEQCDRGPGSALRVLGLQLGPAAKCAVSLQLLQAQPRAVEAVEAVEAGGLWAAGRVWLRFSRCRSSARQRRTSRMSFLPPIAEV